jgi:ADP-ribose pyrophosphatase YjhB (NUDIX family)
LKREVQEETGLRVHVGSLLSVLDRRDKDAITLLFAASSNGGSTEVKKKQREFTKASFQTSLPNKASPSAKYFWSARKGPIKKAPRIRASTHQLSDV